MFKYCITCGTKFYKGINYSKKIFEEKAKYCFRKCKDESLKGKPVFDNTGKKLSESHKRKIGSSLKSSYENGERRIIYEGLTHKFENGHIPWNKDKKGIRLSPKTEFKKGTIPWNKNKKGSEPWNKGKIFEKIRADKHWNWQGGKPKKNNHGLTYEEQRKYNDWRKAVYKRDNWNCQECGKHGGVLHADHMKSWVAYPELRYELDNGRTLCPPCHQKTETYGKKTSLL